MATFREQFASDLEGCEFDAEGGNCEMQLDQSVNGNQHSRPNSDTNVSSSSWELKTVTVEHIWFYRWEDFGVPSRAFFGVSEATSPWSSELFVVPCCDVVVN